MPPTWKVKRTSSGDGEPIVGSTPPELLKGLFARDVRAVFVEGGPDIRILARPTR
jgi:hypothetical protein